MKSTLVCGSCYPQAIFLKLPKEVASCLKMHPRLIMQSFDGAYVRKDSTDGKGSPAICKSRRSRLGETSDRGVELPECKLVPGRAAMLCKVLIGRTKANHGMPYGCIRHADAWNVGKPEVGIKSTGEGRSRDFNEVTIAANLLRTLPW